jgi:Sel1 repeat-containing protein
VIFPGVLEHLMKYVFLAIFCAAVLVANPVAHAADPISDKEMADRYFQAAQSGDDDAQFYLGALYSSGVGRPRSDEQAFQWFSRAANQGHSHAMLVVSGLYAIGRGTLKDNISAYKWAYIVSVGTRVEEFRNGARQLMGLLETKTTAADLSRARSEAAAWHAAPIQPRLAAPTDSPPSQPPSTVLKPSPPPSAPAASTATSSNPQPQPPRANGGKKDDVDGMMDRVPSELRKRFGF